MSNTGFRIAIVGSGPSGCYAAQFLNKSLPSAAIYVFEKLPVPYGLLRYGIAADHQGSKNVSNQFDRIFKQPNVFFCGNVTIGEDLSFADLKESFNLIIFATGLEYDKQLNIPIDEKCHVIGAGSLLKSLNAHPHHIAISASPLGSSIGIIGAGNVSMDVVRLLCVQNEHLVNSDIFDSYLTLIRSKTIKKIDVFSRSAAKEAKFDLSMLKEIIALEHVKVSFSDDDQIFNDLEESQLNKVNTSIKVCFHFNASPEKIEHCQYQNKLHVKRRSNDLTCQFDNDCVVTAIGFENLQNDPSAVQANWTGDFIYQLGWLSSAGNGTVAANRKAVKAKVDEILSSIQKNSDHNMLQIKNMSSKVERQIQQAVSFEQWLKIDNFEKKYKPSDRCRKKVITENLMLMIAKTPAHQIEKQTYINVA